MKNGGATKDGGFHTTRWSVIVSAADEASPNNQEALAQLCGHYWYPIYAFARRRGYGAHDSQDLTQSFFQHLLEQNALNRATPVRGRFRTFLLASFQNHISHAREKAQAAKRGGGYQLLSLNAEAAEDRYLQEPADYLTAEQIFEARWAMNVIAQAMRRLGEEYASREKTATFEALKSFLYPINAKPPLSYEQASSALLAPCRRPILNATTSLLYARRCTSPLSCFLMAAKTLALERRRRARIKAWGAAKRNPRERLIVDQALKERQMLGVRDPFSAVRS